MSFLLDESENPTNEIEEIAANEVEENPTTNKIEEISKNEIEENPNIEATNTNQEERSNAINESELERNPESNSNDNLIDENVEGYPDTKDELVNVDDTKAESSQDDVAMKEVSNEKIEVEATQDTQNEEVELWNLTKLFSIKEIKSKKAVKCGNSDICSLFACVTYTSSLGTTWYTCLDCQEMDYEGWPEDPNEMPKECLTMSVSDFLALKPKYFPIEFYLLSFTIIL